MAKSARSYTSELPSAPERFLSKVVSFNLEAGYRTPRDFIRHFSPYTIMAALEEARDLRAHILAGTAGVHEKIARRKSTEAAAEDLQLALDEGVTEAADVLELFPPDERVRHLDRQALWTFISEDEFWTAQPSDVLGHRRSAERIGFMLEQALGEQLITLKDVMDGIGFDEISARLPEAKLRQLVQHALKLGRDGSPLNEENLLAVVPLTELVEIIPLEHTWTGLMLTKIAEPASFVFESASPSRRLTAPRPEAADEEPADEDAEEIEAAPLSSAEPTVDSESFAPEPIDIDHELDSETASEVASLVDSMQLRDEDSPGDPGRESQRPLEDEARRRVTQHLSTMERLPPNHANLNLPILLSIESMYADLLTLSSDEEREACIRESFPNETHLRTAMLALIELLDANVNTQDPVIAEADVDSLMKVVLFEERQRFEQSRPSGGPGVGGGKRRVTRRSAPPPLPGGGSSDADDSKRAR